MLSVSIQNNESGKIRVYSSPIPDNEFNAWIWSDGNFACDCNRALFYHWAKDSEFDIDDTDEGCGSGHYTVLEIKLSTGQIVYKEEPLYEKDLVDI